MCGLQGPTHALSTKARPEGHEYGAAAAVPSQAARGQEGNLAANCLRVCMLDSLSKQVERHRCSSSYWLVARRGDEVQVM